MPPRQDGVSLRSSGRPPGSRGRTLLFVVVVAILGATLWPLGSNPGFHDNRLSFRVLPADFIRNLLLFFPLGVALSRRGSGYLGSVLFSLALSACIETTQLFIPGRYANGADLVSNLLGALLGAAVQRTSPGWLWPGPRAANRLALTASAVLVAVVIGTGWLVAPELPATAYYAGLTPTLGHMAHYEGHVRSAEVGDLLLRDGPVAASERLRELWLAGKVLRIDAEAGPPTRSLAPILTLHDELRREILVLGVEEDDLVVRGRNWAQVLGLDRASLRFAGALTGIEDGMPLVITARRDGHGFCLSVDGRSACPLGFTAGSGWRLLWTPQILPTPTRDWFNGVWLAVLAFPLGLWLRPTAAGATALTVSASVLLGAPLAGLLRTPSFELAAAAVGLAAGLAVHAALPSRRSSGGPLLGARGTLPPL